MKTAALSSVIRYTRLKLANDLALLSLGAFFSFMELFDYSGIFFSYIVNRLSTTSFFTERLRETCERESSMLSLVALLLALLS